MSLYTLPPDFLAGKLPPMESFAEQMHRQVSRETERLLVERIEHIDGRKPTEDDVRAHGACAFYPDGRTEWKWRGQTILIVHPLRVAENHSLLIDFQ